MLKVIPLGLNYGKQDLPFSVSDINGKNSFASGSKTRGGEMMEWWE